MHRLRFPGTHYKCERAASENNLDQIAWQVIFLEDKIHVPEK